DGQLRRLSATRDWQIVDGTGPDPALATGAFADGATALERDAGERDHAEGNGAPARATQRTAAPGGSAPPAHGQSRAADGSPGAGPHAARAAVRRHWHPQGDALLRRWLDNAAQPQSHFDLRADAEAWAGWASTDRLVSLESLRGVERFPHQEM